MFLRVRSFCESARRGPGDKLLVGKGTVNRDGFDSGMPGATECREIFGQSLVLCVLPRGKLMFKETLRASLVLIALISLFGLGTSSAQVPAPEDVLGFGVGADYHLATYEQAVGYFRVLEEASPMMKVLEMGETSMGKSMIYAVITSEKNMADLDHYKEISGKLARAKGLGDEEARRLASEGKAVVWVDAGIHATEVAPAQALIQFAYDLLTSQDEDTRLILDNTIVLLVFANPDGMTMVSEWYMPNVGSPYETSPLPWLYHVYAGHDNNRDSYMNNLVETKNITRIVTREWHPVVLYDHHQRGPFPARIWIPPAAEPTNPNLHPLFIREKNLIGTAMGYAFDREEKPGAISRFRYDFIYPGYEDSFCDFFNVVSIMTETHLYDYATPHFYTLDEFPEAYKDFTIGVFYPNPWKGGWWRLRDAVDYAITATKAVLHTGKGFFSAGTKWEGTRSRNSRRSRLTLISFLRPSGILPPPLVCSTTWPFPVSMSIKRKSPSSPVGSVTRRERGSCPWTRRFPGSSRPFLRSRIIRT